MKVREANSGSSSAATTTQDHREAFEFWFNMLVQHPLAGAYNNPLNLP